MAVELVTGYSGAAHVTSSQDGARQAGTVGAGKYVLETGGMLAATLENANTVSVAGGDAMINGRHVHLSGATAFAVPVGAQGRKTSNLLVLRYSVADDGTERVEALTLTGEPSDGAPADPPLAEGSVLDGASPVDMALYRVVTEGAETAQPERLFETVAPVAVKADKSHKHSAADVTSGTLAVARGGTGVTTDKAIALKAYPVGAVYISYVSTSPASLFGGSWTAITGRFPYFNAGTSTGGTNFVHLNAAQMPEHSHKIALLGNGSSISGGVDWAYASNNSGYGGSSEGSGYLQTSGGASTFDNRPAYQTLYAWRRTA